MISGISQELIQQFGTDIPIYSEITDQVIRKPCFLINLAFASESRQLAGYYISCQTVIISYIPENDIQQTLYSVLPKLKECLRVIPIGDGIIRASKQQNEISGGILKYKAEYNFRIVKPMQPKEIMRKLTMKGGIKKREKKYGSQTGD